MAKRASSSVPHRRKARAKPKQGTVRKRAAPAKKAAAARKAPAARKGVGKAAVRKMAARRGGRSTAAAPSSAVRKAAPTPARRMSAGATPARKAAAAGTPARQGRKTPARKTPAGKTPARKTPIRAAKPAPQRFTVSHLREEDFQPNGLRPYARYRDLGIAEATGGLARAHVIRMIPPVTDEVRQRHAHTVDLQLVYVLKGWMKNEF
ncbi:MAG TPA: hypothetical protein VNE67_12565, partial [Acetobacteraceae bacterium]|nr:hypothetical protein [Acetobacteraceae bacterium]